MDRRSRLLKLVQEEASCAELRSRMPSLIARRRRRVWRSGACAIRAQADADIAEAFPTAPTDSGRAH